MLWKGFLSKYKLRARKGAIVEALGESFLQASEREMFVLFR